MLLRPAVFVDRDGVLNALAPDPDTGLPESPYDPADVRLLEGVAPALLALRGAGYLLVCVTNQPGAAKAKTDVATLHAVNDAVLGALAAEGFEFDGVEICLHHPEGVVPELTIDCDCRKPNPGMLLHAAQVLGIDLSSSWMIGDSDSDVTAARRAGCRSVQIDHQASAHRRGEEQADLVATNLPEAASLLLKERRVGSSPS